MKARHLIMVLGLAGAAWLALFGDKTPNSNIAEPAERTSSGKSADKRALAVSAVPAVTSASSTPTSVAAPLLQTSDAAASSSAPRKKEKPEPVIRALLPRAELIGGASSANKAGALFVSQNWTPPPPPPPQPSAPPPPTAPALPFTFLGKKLEDAKWEVYLAHGDNTIIVHEKSVVDAVYRIDSIIPPNMTLTYLPLNQVQMLPIGGGE